MIRPIQIQKLNEKEKIWEPLGKNIHANVNKAKEGSSYLSSGSEQSKASKTFCVKYAKELEAIQFAKQSYRIIMDGMIYEIKDYDDYQEQHIKVELLGVSRGVRAD